MSRGGYRPGAGRRKGAKTKNPAGNARPDNLITPSELVVRRNFRKAMGEWTSEHLYNEFLGVLDRAKDSKDERLVFQTLSEIAKITVGTPVPMAEVNAADTFAEMIRRMAGVNEAGEPLPSSSLSPGTARALLPASSTPTETDRPSNSQSNTENKPQWSEARPFVVHPDDPSPTATEVMWLDPQAKRDHAHRERVRAEERERIRAELLAAEDRPQDVQHEDYNARQLNKRFASQTQDSILTERFEAMDAYDRLQGLTVVTPGGHVFPDVESGIPAEGVVQWCQIHESWRNRGCCVRAREQREHVAAIEERDRKIAEQAAKDEEEQARLDGWVG